MSTKTLALIALFSALSIALSLSPLKFPAPYAPFLYYQLWEIPIVMALLLYGIKVGFIIPSINALVLFVFFPGDLPIGPLYNFIAILSTLLGLYVIQISLSNHFDRGKEVILTALATVSGMITRVAVMSVVNWIALPLDFPFGYTIPPEILPGMIATVALFNATIVLYTIPLGYIITRAIGIRTEVQLWKHEQANL
jgi:riboflavin transporter FmnP